jgi:hypothetical protein
MLMIMPPGHHKDVAARRGVSGRERGFVFFGGGVVIALIVVLVIAISSGSSTSGHGCVYATVSSSTGALTIQGCGRQARKICADVSVPGSYTPSERAAVVPECRKAGLPTRRTT